MFITAGKPRSALYKIPLNEDGIPIPPHVQVLDASIAQLATLLDEYLLSLWGKYFDVFVRPRAELMLFLDFSQAQSTNQRAPISTIPWEQIARNPDAFYDTAAYELPCSLKSPELLKSEPFSIITLYQYFSTIATAQPFQFRSRWATSKDCTALGNSDDDGDHRGDELEVEIRSNPRIFSSPAPTAPLDRPVFQATRSDLIAIATNPLPTANIPPAVSPSPGAHDPSPLTTFTTTPPSAAAPSQPVTTATVKAPTPLAVTTTTPLAVPPATMPPAEVPPMNVSTGGALIPNEGSCGIGAPTNSPVAQKKGKGRQGTKRKPAPFKKRETVGDVNPPSRRTSTRTIELKRKELDTEAVDTQPVKKKKTTLRDRWFYAGEETQA